MNSARSSQRGGASELDEARRESSPLSESIQSDMKELTMDEETSLGSNTALTSAKSVDAHASDGLDIAVEVGDHPGWLEGKSKARSESQDAYLNRVIAQGVVLRDQCLGSGVVEEAIEAIECWELAASLASGTHPHRPGVLNDLGALYSILFKRLGNLSDLEKATMCRAEANALTADGDSSKPVYLANLGSSYLDRFEYLDELADLDKAIECGSQAVSLIPKGHIHESGMISNLGGSYMVRFERSGKLIDLDKAIECKARALTLTSDGHTNYPHMLSSLGNSYRARFEYLGNVVDLNQGVEYGTQAVLLTPDRHLDKPGRLNNLGVSYLTRFERFGELVDLDKSIEYKAEAVLLIPNDHPAKPSLLSNLANSYRARFEHLGHMTDLDKATECGAQAVELIPDGHPGKPSSLSTLGVSYQIRFDRLGNIIDLNKAITCGSHAVSLAPDGHTDKPGILHNLGVSYLSRFKRLGERQDVEKAIVCQVEAASLTPNGHSDQPAGLDNLGNLYRTRFEHFGELADLNTAIDCGARALTLTPEDHPTMPDRLKNLAYSYVTRFERLGEVVDLNKAIECGVQAVSLTSDGHAEKPSRLNSLGVSYFTRFTYLGDLVDLNKAIECEAGAIVLTPNGHPEKPSRLCNLGNSYTAQFDRTGEISALDSAITCFKDARSLAGPPSVGFHACLMWARWVVHHPTSSPYPAYQQAMELLPQLIWVGTTLEQRYSLLTGIGELSTEAASYAISIGEHETALEWLEAGRSVIWGQIAQLRTPFDQLYTRDPRLANELKEIGRQLERAGGRSPSTSSSKGAEEHWDDEPGHHIQPALDWEKLLNKARSISGFEGFLRAPKTSRLLGAAKAHPIAVIITHKSRCDALILRPDTSSVSHVPLIQFSAVKASMMRESLASLDGYRGFTRVNKSAVGSLEGLLNDLWSGVVKPVLDFLGYTRKLPTDQLPQLTWCTTGIFSFLPLHAAGCYDQPVPKAFDLVISSYAPPISALLSGQTVTLDAQRGILAVGQEHTPGFDRLPCIKDELAVVRKHVQANSYLQLEDDEATIDRVVDAMDQFSWVHMACHGTQNLADPTQSAFHLHDGSLTLAAITKRSFKNKGLAFLSACQTAAGDKELPEEAVHLAAGILMAGFPSVIGTMWSIADEDGPAVADKVYAELLKDGAMDHTKAARALHQAVADLHAKVGEKAFSRWAPFIHIGA